MPVTHWPLYIILLIKMAYSFNVMTLQDTVLAIGSEHPSIDLYSTTTGTFLVRLEGHTNRLEHFYSSDGGWGWGLWTVIEWWADCVFGSCSWTPHIILHVSPLWNSNADTLQFLSPEWRAWHCHQLLICCFLPPLMAASKLGHYKSHWLVCTIVLSVTWHRV